MDKPDTPKKKPDTPKKKSDTLKKKTATPKKKTPVPTNMDPRSAKDMKKYHQVFTKLKVKGYIRDSYKSYVPYLKDRQEIRGKNTDITGVLCEYDGGYGVWDTSDHTETSLPIFEGVFYSHLKRWNPVRCAGNGAVGKSRTLTYNWIEERTNTHVNLPRDQPFRLPSRDSVRECSVHFKTVLESGETRYMWIPLYILKSYNIDTLLIPVCNNAFQPPTLGSASFYKHCPIVHHVDPIVVGAAIDPPSNSVSTFEQEMVRVYGENPFCKCKPPTAWKQYTNRENGNIFLGCGNWRGKESSGCNVTISFGDTRYAAVNRAMQLYDTSMQKRMSRNFKPSPTFKIVSNSNNFSTVNASPVPEKVTTPPQKQTLLTRIANSSPMPEKVDVRKQFQQLSNCVVASQKLRPKSPKAQLTSRKRDRTVMDIFDMDSDEEENTDSGSTFFKLEMTLSKIQRQLIVTRETVRRQQKRIKRLERNTK